MSFDVIAEGQPFPHITLAFIMKLVNLYIYIKKDEELEINFTFTSPFSKNYRSGS